MATHSSILVQEISWAEEPGRLWSMGSQRSMIEHEHENTHMHTHTHTHNNTFNGRRCSLSLNGFVKACRCSVVGTLGKRAICLFILKQWRRVNVFSFPLLTLNVWLSLLNMNRLYSQDFEVSFKQCLEGIILIHGRSYPRPHQQELVPSQEYHNMFNFPCL